MKRLLRRLSSPRLAVWLIAAISVYSAVATSVPQQDADPKGHALWIADGGFLTSLARLIGLDHAFSTPLFFGLTALLASSTIACSIKRSSTAARRARQRGAVTPQVVQRLREMPDAEVQLQMDQHAALAEVSSRLRSLGLKSRVGPKVGYAESHLVGLFGSPLFHWSLVGLIAVVTLGQMTRWEGMIAVPQGTPVTEAANSFGRLSGGPLALPHTGWTLALPSVDENYEANGVSYGWTPTVSVTDGRRRTVTQRVHPNRPLRHGPLLIHAEEYGLSARFDVLDEKGTVLDSLTLPFDFDDSTASGTTTRTAEVSLQGVSFDVDVSPHARDLRGALPRVRPPRPTVGLTVKQNDNSASNAVLGIGESFDFQEGSLRLADVGYYARLTVVRDWSVDWIYILMGLATLAMTLTLIFPYRSVWFLAEEREGNTHVYVIVRGGQKSAAFRLLVSEAVTGGG